MAKKINTMFFHTNRGANGRFKKGGKRKQWISNCCETLMKVEGKKTKWYICTNCKRPCNPKEKE